MSKFEHYLQSLVFFWVLEIVFWAELWLGKKGSFTEESDGVTAGVLILLATTVCNAIFFYKFN